MSSFGDFEPEDAWDAEDPTDQQARNLLRRLVLLDGAPDPVTTDVPTILDIIEHRIERQLARRDMTRAEMVRLGLIVSDVLYVRDRHG